MGKVKVCIMNLEKEGGKFRFLKEMELSRVPVAGDKVIIAKEDCDEMTVTLVYDVVSVLLDNHGKTDALVVCVGSYTDFLKSLASTQCLK